MIQPQSDELGVAPDISVRTLKDFCSWALEKWRDDPGQDSLREKALCAAREAAEVIVGLAKARRSDADRELALDLARTIRESGIHAGGFSSANLLRAEELRRDGWTGIVASMLLVPAWAFGRPLTYDAVPRWLWAEYTRYLFAVPQKAWASNLANAYASNMRQSLDMLLHLCRANRGSIAVQAARSAYFEQQGAQVLAAASCSLSECITLRGKISNYDLTTTSSFEPNICGRSGRPLRIGVCLPAISDTSAARAVLALVEHLPEERFDVQYFVLEYTYGRMEEKLRTASANITLMDGLYPQHNLEMASLDAALLLIDPLEAQGPLTQLGYRRFAPLQIAMNLKGTPTGLPEIDLFLGIERSAADLGTERTGILPLPAIAIATDEPAGPPSMAYTRNALGIPDEARVLGSLVPFKTISFEMMEAWAGILSAEPDSHLLLHLYSDSAQEDEEVLACCREIDGALVARGIPTERLTVLGARQPFFEDWVTLMRVSDVHLDSYPCSTPLAVAAALTAGIPSVCWTGDEPRMRSGARMLESENLGRNVAVDLAHCVELACSLLSSDQDRAQVRDSLAEALGKGMAIHDSLAASDAFGGLVEAAFDEICESGTEEFKSKREPFAAQAGCEANTSLKDIERMVASGLDREALAHLEKLLACQPLRLDLRRLAGQVLARSGMHKRSIAYQKAALRKTPRDAGGWFDLSRSLFRDDKVAEACRMLHQSIKLDPSQPEAWFFLGEVTINAKDEQGARSIIDVLRKLAPSDERLADLERLAAELAGARAAETSDMSVSGPRQELIAAL
jgi:predicted O-linked N-acetylglucosamine transferase (SPINDLY family)